jgi:hypothetical protein
MENEIPVVQDTIKLDSKRSVMRLLLYVKLLENGIKCSEKDLEILTELYEFGGYHSHQEEVLFFAKCIDLRFRRSNQSLRNVLTRFKKLGVIKKLKIHQRQISPTYLPDIKSDKVGLMFFVSNAN